MLNAPFCSKTQLRGRSNTRLSSAPFSACSLSLACSGRWGREGRLLRLRQRLSPISSTEWGRSISRCFEVLGECKGQVTVEAALLLPSFLFVLLLALQPVCLLYTRAVMEGAAAETARLMVTGSDGNAEAYRAFTLRRLAAVPDLALFHEGGPLSWDIELFAASSGAGKVRVEIEGAVKPLPVLGAFAGLWGERNGRGDVLVRVEVSYEGRPSWLEGSYETWIASWS